MATILFFASVREKMGRDEMRIPLSGPVTVEEIMTMAAREAGVDASALLGGSLMYVVNRHSAGKDSRVEDGDEVAALPPMSGGM